MTDVRQQLTEALDEIEREARAALDPADRWWWNVPESAAERHISRWRPEFVLRLVERDREMLDEHRDDRPDWRCACTGSPTLPCRELRRAAAFWVGTPEVGHPQHCTTGACRRAPTQTLDGEPRCDFCVSVITAPPGTSEVTDGRDAT